jgi:hypothetical protein
MKQTVVGVFDRHAQAHAAAQRLRDSGFGDSVFVTDEADAAATSSSSARAAAPDDDHGVLARVRHFFADLFGDDDRREVGRYAEAVRRGGALVKVEVADEAQLDAARSALQAAGALDINQQAEQWRASGWDEGTSLMSGPVPASGEATGASEAVRPSTTTRGHADVTEHPGELSADADWRSHYDRHYAAGGDSRYQDYEPAYRMGSAMRTSDRYAGRDWDSIEADARRDWESRADAGPWERFKAAVRHGWEHVTR